MDVSKSSRVAGAERLGRRDVLGWSAAAATIAVTGASGWTAEDADSDAPIRRDRLRIGFVGVGVKGWQHMRNLLHIEGAEIAAVCDILEEPCRRTVRTCRTLGLPEPKVYTGDEYEFRRMCDEVDLDLVYTATPWRWHVPVCLAALRSGSIAATEIPAALTVEDAWELVETCEQTGLQLSMMENVNYRRTELAILRMVREGVLGELIHAEAGYAHDTRYLKVRDYGDGLWLGEHHARRNGNLYPTHGLGPIAWDMNLGRGNRMQYLVSMSSKARGMNLYAEEHLPKDHPYRRRQYINGDVNTCLIRCDGGETILIKHDTDLPRPYSRTNLVQGTRGIVRGYPEFLISTEGQDLTEGIDDPKAENAYKGPHHRYGWRSGESAFEKFDHPLWKFISAKAETTPVAADGYDLREEIRSGDYLEDYRLVQQLRRDLLTDFDVYDAASWSVVAPLSEQSVAAGSRPIEFPDFTRGKWRSRQPLRLMGV